MEQVEYKLQLAEDFEKEGKYLHALQIYYSLFHRKEFKRTAIVKLSSLYEKMDKADQAVKLFESYLLDNFDVEMRKYFSHYLIQNLKYTKAIEVLQYVSKEDNPEVYFLSGLASYKLGDYEIAKINFSEFTRKNRKSDLLPEAYLYLSKAYRHLNQYDSALENAKYSELIWNNNFELYLNMAKIYFYKKMYFHAFESITKAIKLNNIEPSLLKWAGKILYFMDEYEKAEDYLRKFVNHCNEDPEIYALLGNVCLKNKKPNDQ